MLSVGRLHQQKNVSRVLEILLAIRNQSGIPAIARVIGDGPERQNLEKFAHRHGLDGAVSFEGWLPRNDVAAAYRSATVLVHLSSYEGMSNVVLEALASGLPVVASRISENMELIEPELNGLLRPERGIPENRAGNRASVRESVPGSLDTDESPGQGERYK